MISLSLEALQMVGLVCLIGLVLLLLVAWSARSKSWKISTFFLAGRNIGAPLTTHVYWGTSFSLANGLFYFSYLGYYYGLSVIWLQIPWVLAIWFLAWQLPQIIKETNRFTLHGFLGDLYGPRVRLLASIVTLTGFLGFFAFEINVSLEILGRVVGFSELVPPFTILIAVYSAAYCDIGGFAGTAKTDFYQNMLGLLAVGLIVFCVFRVPHSSIPITNLSISSISDSFFDISSIPIITVVGILCYAFTYNIVDMSNWQVIAANSATKKENIKSLRYAMIKSTGWIIILPATVGTFFGYVWQGVEIGEYERVSYLVEQVFPNASYIGGVIIGLVVLGLSATTMSTADSYLIASAQTFSWDIKDKEIIDSEQDSNDLAEEIQYELVRNTRRRLYYMAIISVVAFLFLRNMLGDQTIFVAQFLLAGLVISLAPATIFGLYCRYKSYQPEGFVKFLSEASIVVGYLCGLIVFLYFLIYASEEFDVYAWGPISTLSSSCLLCGVACFLMKKNSVETS